jgi:hypothetical protein
MRGKDQNEYNVPVNMKSWLVRTLLRLEIQPKSLTTK